MMDQSAEQSASRGMFITFEGIDGSGKSTQAARLVRALREQGRPVIHTREPGGTRLGIELRRLLLGGRNGTSATYEPNREGARDDAGAAEAAPGYRLAPVTEMLLMAADRAQHVEQVVRPALAAGHIVVSERYTDSSLAYQSGGMGVPEADVRRVNDVATGSLRPDLTIWLDLPPERAYPRAGKPDRIELRGAKYQQRVRTTYERLARQEPERWVRLPVDGLSVEQVQTFVAHIVQARLEQWEARP